MAVFPSSEDELSAAPVITPPRYEFRSDISDDDPSYQDEVVDSDTFATLGGEGNPPRLVKIEVSLPSMTRGRRAAYKHVEVLDWEEDFIANGSMSRGPKRQRTDDEVSSGNNGAFDSDDVEMDDSPQNSPRLRPRRLRRNQTSSTSTLHRESRRKLRPRTTSQAPTEGRQLRKINRTRVSFPQYSSRQSTAFSDREDELAAETEDLDSDGNFVMVQSHLVGPSKKRRRGRPARTQFRDSSIEFEARRSTRGNKNTKRINYVTWDDDDDFGYQEEKVQVAPKAVGVREVFKRSEVDEFVALHRPVCEVCNGPDKAANKGVLIHCQGCSNSYHKYCIGLRSIRDHCVTKVGPEFFVLQCRFCIGNFGSGKKETRTHGAPRSPRADACQMCHVKAPACAAFSPKKTPKQEEKLRAENEGVDPVTPVAAGLLDNPKNVLFRCSTCRRGFHWEHLPHPTSSRDPAKDDPNNIRKYRLDEYSISWLCRECMDVDSLKAQALVAWRPLDKDKFDSKDMVIGDLREDEVEYLIKWEGKSYRHCLWMPGAWAYGYIAPLMRASFFKRNDSEFTDEADELGRNLRLKFTSEEAVPDAYITPDVILDVHTAPRSGADESKYKQMSAEEKKESDLSRIYHTTRIFVKFEGLGYDEAVWDEPPSPDNESIWASFHAAYQEYLNGKHFSSETARNIQERAQQFLKLNFQKDIELNTQPAGLRRGKLMDYQLAGVNWLLWSYRLERSVILADEMGLGKTVQVVALLSSFIQDNPKMWPFLIVVPNSTCPNWRREIKKWAPDLRVVAYYGGKASQDLAYQYELFPGGSRQMKAHVVVMSYDSAQDDRTKYLFKSVKWMGLVVDEAQHLKNDENLLYKALINMRIPWSLLLTGTPLQNNKRELFNLLQFIDPREMNAAALDAEFQDLTQERVQELHKRIRKYMLRRTKAQVLTFLPPMAQIIVPVSMTVLQEKLCKTIMEKNPQLIRSIFFRGKLKVNEKTGLNNILMQLRKCLCHPFIYSKSIEDVNTPVETMRRNLIEASSKLLLLETMLPILKERGHRVLIFSQFLEQLTILEDFLNSLMLRHERLDGSLSSIEKQKRIDAFNDPDSELFCMLLSTRAGGVGINLATADTVIILDPDFNPHQDIQALSRAHRIGQKKKVLCFQLMTQDSAEEKIIQIGRKKMVLDHVLIESMDEEGENSNDMESILKHGAAALFSEDKKKDVIVYDRAAVEKLLDRSANEETNAEDGTAESAFAYAKVWANDGTLAEEVNTVDHVVNVGVWDDILKEREEAARQEALKNMEVLGRGGRRRQTTNYTGPEYGFEEPEPKESKDAQDKGSDVDEDFKGGESEAETSEEDEDHAQNLAGTRPRKNAVNKTATPNRANARKQVASSATHKQAASRVASKPTAAKEVAVKKASVSSSPPKHHTPNSHDHSQTPKTTFRPHLQRFRPCPKEAKQSLIVTLQVPSRPLGTLKGVLTSSPAMPKPEEPQDDITTPGTVTDSPTEQVGGPFCQQPPVSPTGSPRRRKICRPRSKVLSPDPSQDQEMPDLTPAKA